MRQKILSFLVFFILLTPAYANERIVYLDVEKIMQQSVAGKSIIAQIKKKRESTIAKLKSKEKDILEKEKKIISQKNVLNDEEFKKKLKDLRNDISNFQNEIIKNDKKIVQLRVSASTKLLKKVTPILEEYSKKNSISIIVQKKNIVMGKKEQDITKDILEIVNQKVKNIKID